MHEPIELSTLFPSQQPQTEPATSLALLDHERILAVSGKDATRFLQGQITCDVASLTPGNQVLGARCNPKGRMQSSFRLFKVSEESYLLALASELLEPQQKDLAKYAVFFKVQLEDVTDQWLRLGLWGQDCTTIISSAEIEQHQGLVLPVAEHTFELWLPSSAHEQINVLVKRVTPVPTNAWTLQLIRQGIGQVRIQTWESFIPQMLNLQHLGGISFRKGCYTGQEIVARMQYLGKLKRRMYRLLLAGDQLPLPGTSIHDSNTQQAVGEVVMAAQADNHIELLAVLQKEAAESTSLTLNNSTRLLQPTSLPYEQELTSDSAAH